jgi:hypothetical protein
MEESHLGHFLSIFPEMQLKFALYQEFILQLIQSRHQDSIFSRSVNANKLENIPLKLNKENC